MADPINFLNGLAQALSALSLYPEGHTSRERALDQVYLSLRDLLDDDPSPSFSFLGDEVIYNDRPIRELREWGWSKKLSDIGVQRLLFTVESTRDELEDFLAFRGRGFESGQRSGRYLAQEESRRAIAGLQISHREKSLAGN